MSSGETTYTYRVPHPEVLERGRTQVVTLEVYDESGTLTAPEAATSTFELLSPSGEVVVAEDGVTVTGSIATYEIQAADLPATLDFSDRYQCRWTLDLPGLTSPQTIRRVCTVAPFAFPHIVAEVDLTQGRYPRLAALVSKMEGVTLTDFLHQAQRHVMTQMRAQASWPEMVVDADSLGACISEYALYLVFRAMAAGRTGEADRWGALQEVHLVAYKEAWTTCTSMWDRDGDGLADDEGRQAMRQPAHINGAPRRNRRPDPRW
jgi:hypothetical protein